MFGPRFNPAKCETSCRLSLGRFKLQKNKKTLQIKQYRKEIAELLRQGKQEYARIRVEAVIRENFMLQAYEILELYLELLIVRTQMIAKTKEIPRDMIEAISSIIYAATRVSDMPELTTLKAIFASKYGKEYVGEAASDVTCQKWHVNENLKRCLMVEPPQPEDKLSFLSEIAQEHDVEWDLSEAARQLLPQAPVGSVALPVPVPIPAPVPAAAQQPISQQPGLYRDAQEAATAAAHMATQAQQAAAFAAQMAQAQWAAAPRGPQQSYPSATTSTPPLMPQSPAPPPHGFHPPASPAPSQPAYAVRTEEEIRKAYDAALGPPTKDMGHKGEPGAPPFLDQEPTAAAAPLPPPPPAVVAPTPNSGPSHSSSAPSPVPSAVEDEYEQLTKRLEALKNS